jgi:hypothetical protein
MTYYFNGVALPEGADFTTNGFTYPYSWLENSSPAVRASLGIEAIGDINYDTKYYWDVNNPKILEDREELDDENNPVYVKVFNALLNEMVDSDKPLITKGLKTTCTGEIKDTANVLLKPTDYYIIRNAVEEVEIPNSVSTYRSAIITEQDRVVAAIAATTTVEELIAIMASVNWPKAD